MTDKQDSKNVLNVIRGWVHCPFRDRLLIGTFTLPEIISPSRSCFRDGEFTCLTSNNEVWGRLFSLLAQGMLPLPSIEYSIAVLHRCRTVNISVHATVFSAFLYKTGLEFHPSLHNCLVLTLLEAGYVSHAQQLLDKFGLWDDYLWNATTVGYAKIGDLQSALDLYEAAQEVPTLRPSSYTFVALLKSCIKMKNVEIGHKLHSDLAEMDFLENDVFISSTLINMYIKFGFLAKAEKVFQKLLVRNAVVWTALMNGYADMGQNREVLCCFEQMNAEGILLDGHTYVCALKACSNLKEREIGQELHAAATRLGLVDEDTFVGSTLVDFYLKCGMVAEARQVFDGLLVKDVVSWTTLITGYADHGYGESVFECLKQMQLQGISPNAHTFVSMLSACGGLGIATRGREAYYNIALFGLEGELIISNSLIDMFTKCGSLMEAQAVFDNSPAQDLISWTTLITGYAHLGKVEGVIHIFGRMIGEGLKPDILSFRIILNSCSHTGVLEIAQAYFHAIRSQFDFVPSLHHYNCMIDLLGRAGHMDTAVRLIEIMPFHPGIVTWHSVLGACRKWGDLRIARHVFEHTLHLDHTDVGAFVCMSNLFTDTVMQMEALEFEVLQVE